MADLEFVDNSASSDKLLESMHVLRPLLSARASTDPFQSMQTMMDSNIPCSAPVAFSPATVSPEDLELPTMLKYTTEHEMLLPGIGATSLGINCDEWSRLLEHSDEWNLPLDQQNYPASWKAPEDSSSEHKNVFSQAAMGGSHSFTAADQLFNMKVPEANRSWCNEKSQQDGAAANAETLTLASSASAKQEVASVRRPQSAGVRQLGRSKSVNDMKQIDSSDNNSDDVDDDVGSKLSPNGKNPVSKNLVSERRRRKKLNERLYSLRAIVPKISKMDKASIVGDAIGHVRDLQKQVEDMQGEIVTLQSNKDALQDGCSTVGIASSNGNEPGLNMSEHKLLELEVSQMEEQTYHLRICCKRGPAVFVQLTRALEALDLDIINANLTSVNDRILNTLVVKVKSNEVLNIEALKSMIFGVFPKLGFQIVL